MNVCDYCGARMRGGGQGFRDYCPNGCDEIAATRHSQADVELQARWDAQQQENLEAIERTAKTLRPGERLERP